MDLLKRCTIVLRSLRQLKATKPENHLKNHHHAEDSASASPNWPRSAQMQPCSPATPRSAISFTRECADITFVSNERHSCLITRVINYIVATRPRTRARAPCAGHVAEKLILQA